MSVLGQSPEYIPISKELCPYKFDIILNGNLYTFKINYNATGDFFTADLNLGDKVLVQGEKILLDQILFRQLYEDNSLNLDEDFPTDILMAQSYNGNVPKLGYKQLESNCLLYAVPRNLLVKE